MIARVLRTRNKRANAGEVLTDGSYIRRSGTLPTYMQAARLQGGSIGVHAAEIGASHSLCACARACVAEQGERGDAVRHRRAAQARRGGSESHVQVLCYAACERWRTHCRQHLRGDACRHRTVKGATGHPARRPVEN